MDGWLGIRSGVQANMNIESFKVQVYQTIQIPYTVVKDLIEHRIEKDNSNLSRNTPRTYNKLSIIKELREVYNLGLKEAKTIVETVSYREGYGNLPINDVESFSLLMFGDYQEHREHSDGVPIPSNGVIRIRE